MIRTLYFGLLSGLLLSIGFLFSQTFLPSPMFGYIPLILAVLPVSAILMMRKGNAPGSKALSGKQSTASSRWIQTGIAAILPVALYLLYISTGYAAFIGQAGFMNFIFLALWYFVLLSIPAFFLVNIFTEPQIFSGQDGTGFILAGTAIGLFIGQLIAGIIPPVAFTALFAVLALLSPMLPATPAVRPKSEKSKPKQSGKKNNAKANRSLPAIDVHILMFFVFGIFPFWVLYYLQKITVFLLPADTLYSYLIPGMLFVFGLGYFLNQNRQLLSPAFQQILGVFALLAALYWGTTTWQTTLFPDLYRAYYNGSDTSQYLVTLSIWLLFIPALASGYLFQLAKSAAPDTRTFGTLNALYSGVAVLIWGVTGWMDWTDGHMLFVVFGILFALYLAVCIVRDNTLKLPIRILVALAAGAGFSAVILSHDTIEFENLFDPSAYKIVHEINAPGGSTTLLQSRNYDDPFYTMFWNQSSMIAECSKDTKADLTRAVNIPMLLHQNPQEILLLGTGSFEEIETIEQYRPKQLTVVESNPQQIQLYAHWLQDRKKERPGNLSFRAERLPAFAAHNTDVYDVIISVEPFAEPYHQSNIFTEAYYKNLSGALAENGMFMQWLPLASLAPGALQRISAAMEAAFPYCQIWTGSMNATNGLAGIIGSNAPVEFTPRFRSAYTDMISDPQQQFALLQMGIPSWEYLAAEYGGNSDVVRSLAGNASPYTAFSSEPLYTPPPAEGSQNEFFRILTMRRFDTAITNGTNDSTATFVEKIFNDRPAIYRAAQQLTMSNDTNAVRALIEVINHNPHNLEAKLVLAGAFVRQASMHISQGQYQIAQSILLQATGISPLNTYMLRLLMIASLQNTDYETAKTCITGIKRLNPRHSGAKDNEATIKAQQGMVQDALLLFENAITMDLSNEEAYCNMATAQFNTGHLWEAVRILDNAVNQAYYKAKPYMLMGMVYEQGGKPDLAAESYENYLRVAKPNDPNMEQVRSALQKIKDNSAE